MDAIITWLESIIESILILVEMVFWMIHGIANLGSMAIGSVNILGETLKILPTVVCSSILTACAILVVLRILGR